MPPASPSATVARDAWPALAYKEWADTCATLHLWTQVVGKIQLALVPRVNHWWGVKLRVTSRGLATVPMSYGDRLLQIEFDFVDHQLKLRCSDGAAATVALAPRTVANFHADVMARLRDLGIDVHIWTMPVEIEGAIPFEQDRTHASYDAGAAQRFWRQLVQADRVMNIFRARFLGKNSPVHFFWGSFDLAVTRFSGRTAPPMTRGAPNVGAWVMQEAYSHEVSSVGFWPGNGGFGRAAFYAYAYPEPDGFGGAPLRPAAAYYDKDLGQFILPYDAVQKSASPDEDVLAFLQSTYEAAANLGKWDRVALERASQR